MPQACKRALGKSTVWEATELALANHNLSVFGTGKIRRGSLPLANQYTSPKGPKTTGIPLQCFGLRYEDSRTSPGQLAEARDIAEKAKVATTNLGWLISPYTIQAEIELATICEAGTRHGGRHRNTLKRYSSLGVRSMVISILLIAHP